MLKYLLLSCAIIFFSSPLEAQERQPWGETGDWIILVDPAVGSGCLMQKNFESGIRIEFGYMPDRDGGFFAAMSEDWTGIKPGTNGTVKFITEAAKFAGDVEMIEVDGRLGGLAFFDNPNFTEEMAARRSITVIGPEGNTFEVDLKGTSRAIKILKECQSAQP